MSIPGMPNCAYMSTGIEHDESGDPGYTPELAARMKSKRFRKLETLREESGRDFVRIWGEPGASDVGIIAYGSTEGVLREAADRARAEGIKVAHLHLRMLNPLPTKQVEEFAARCRTILVPELNFTGQLAGWLRVNTDIKFHAYRKDEGIPFIPNEIYQQIVALASSERALAPRV
jgi:2-oxoglutarate ferredoxin oxidoreductase subunit alpha